MLFVCENNQFATEVPFAYAAGNPERRRRAARPTACPASRSTATTCCAIHAAAGEAIDRARSGDGPTLLECRTYRTRPHAEGMGDFAYRTREEVEEWKTRCPIRRFGRRSIEKPRRRRPSSTRSMRRSPRVVDEAHAVRRGEPVARPGDGRDACLRRAARGDRPSTIRPAPSPIARDHLSCRRRSRPRPPRWRANPTIFVLGEGIGKRGGNFKTTAGLYELYGPERLCDTPICERGFVGLACGAAMTGTRPVDRFHVRRLRPRRASARSSTRSPRCST